MIIGLEEFVRVVFTPPIDIAFGLWIIVPATTGLLSWRRYAGGLGLCIVYGFAMFILLISVPLHLQTIFTWNTHYLIAFPFWYSAIEVPMFFGLAFAMTRLKLR
jgi:hypothetical protein